MSPATPEAPTTAPAKVRKKPRSEKQLAIRHCNIETRKVRKRIWRCFVILALAIVVALFHPAPGLIAIVDEWAMIFSFFLMIIFFLWFVGLRIIWLRLRQRPNKPVPAESTAASA